MFVSLSGRLGTHTIMRGERGSSGCLCLLFASQGYVLFSFSRALDDLYEHPMLAGHS
jgi:hypothetical protein